jgi:hypothetical protein
MTTKKETTNVVKETESTKFVILSVEKSEKYPDRTNVIIDGELTQLDENGMEKIVNQFSLADYALHTSLRATCRRYLKMSIVAGGRALNAGECAAVLAGATVEISRTLKHEGDPREEVAGKETGVYERDIYATKIISVNFDETAMFNDDEVKAIIRENNTINKIAANANPFNF